MDSAIGSSGYRLDDEHAKPLPAAEQQALAVAYRKTRNPKIEQKLVRANLRLVAKLARELDRTRGRQLEDLVQEGTLGLVQAIRRFDPAKGASLTTYAAFWIRAFVMKYIMENVRVVRVVRTRAERVAFFRGVVGAGDLSFDARSVRDATPLRDRVPDPAPRSDELVETAELVERLRRAVAVVERQLDGRDATILKERLLTDEPKSLGKIGRRMSLSGERIRQIEGRLRDQIQSSLGFASLAVAA
jgi:RNA polymerase sigma-32 factor